MVPPRVERWFHTLIVVGASLSACGGKSEKAQQGSGSAGGTGGAPGSVGGAAGTAGVATAGHAASGGALPQPTDCDFVAQFQCDDLARRVGCRCNADAPTSATACASALDYVCSELPCSAPSGTICAGVTYVDCRCDPSGLRPDDCAVPEQFFCAQRYPHFANSDRASIATFMPALLETCVEAWLEGDEHLYGEDLPRGHGCVPRSRVAVAVNDAIDGLILPGLEHVGIDASPARRWRSVRALRGI